MMAMTTKSSIKVNPQGGYSDHLDLLRPNEAFHSFPARVHSPPQKIRIDRGPNPIRHFFGKLEENHMTISEQHIKPA